MAHWRIVVAAAALAGCALASYALMTWAPEQPWSVAVLFGPMLLALGAGGWARRHVPTLAGVAVAAAALAWLVLHPGGISLNSLYVLQHAAIHAALAWSFGLTLRPGATPLVTLLAERLHPVFTPALRTYTRQVTRAWVVYFVAMIAVSLLLYASVPWSWWSFFCNVLTPLAVLAMFVGEYVLRYRLHPEFERTTVAQAWRAYRAHAAGR